MDDHTWINLQKLVGRGPQPSLLDPQTPDHILYADALTALGGGQPSSGPTPYQLMLADALQAHGRTAAPDAGPATPFADASQAYGFGLTPDTPSTGQNDGPSPYGDSNDATTTPGTLYAIGSPADVDLPWQTMADQYAEPPPRPKPPPPQAPAAPSPLQTTIDPIPGYDQTGDKAWRAANDQTFLDAVNRYNAANGYRPGDPGYWTANRLKAQAMQL